MSAERVGRMLWARVYPLYVAKAERKGRTRAEVDAVVGWLTGYDPSALACLSEGKATFAEFFADAPAINPARETITGKVCGVDVQQVADPLMREVRFLDKLVDELAKGRPLEKILRSA